MPLAKSSATRVRKRIEKPKNNDKRFACPHDGCERSFSRAEHLQRHFLNHSAGEHTCERCRAHFKRRDLLERHLLRHRQKDNEAGVPGCGVLNTRKRMWKDTDGNIVARKPALSIAKSPPPPQQCNGPSLSLSNADQCHQADEILPISPPISSDNSLGQPTPENNGSAVPGGYAPNVELLAVPNLGSVSAVDEQFWSARLLEPAQRPQADIPSEEMFNDIFNPDTASSFNNPFTTMNNYNWLFDMNLPKQSPLQPLSDDQVTALQFAHAVTQSGQATGVQAPCDRFEHSPSGPLPDHNIYSQRRDSSFALTPLQQYVTSSSGGGALVVPTGSLPFDSLLVPAEARGEIAQFGKSATSKIIERPMSMLQSSSCLPIIDELTRGQLLDLIDITQPVAPDGRLIMRDHPLLSLPCLQMFCDLYFTRFNTVYPLIHMPTFDPAAVDTLLLTSILLLGATYGEKDAHQLAVCIHDVLRPQIFASGSFSAKPNLWVLQTILLVECFGKSRAGQKQHDMSHLFHGLLINLIRRSDCQTIRSPAMTLNSHDLENDWRLWVDAEQKKRLAFLCFMWDTQHAVLFCQSLCMSAFELRSNLPCPQSLWEADSAESWHRERQKQPSQPLFLSCLKTYLNPTAAAPMHDELDALSRMLLLHGLMSVAWDMQRRDQTALGMVDTNPLNNWPCRLATAYDTWNRDFQAFSDAYVSGLPPTSRSLATEFDAFRTAVSALYHAAQILLITPFLDLQIYAGSLHILGRQISRSDYERSQQVVKKWVTDDIAVAEKAIWHAAAIINQGIDILETPQGDSLGCRFWHLPWAVYLGTLVIWGVWHAYPMQCTSSSVLCEDNEDEIVWDPQLVMKCFLETILLDDPEHRVQHALSSGKRGINALAAVVSKALAKIRWAVVHDGMMVLRGLVSWRSIRVADTA